jgi:tRNA A-37 threonylcarbamoyl transferase component Bud32
VSFQVRPVDVSTSRGISEDRQPSFGSLEAHHVQMAQQQARSASSRSRSLPRPAFGSSPNLQALMLEHEDRLDSLRTSTDTQQVDTFYEVTIASVDQPKLLSRLSEALGDLNLNIAEAHAFNTTDKFSLDVFVVNGWTGQGTEDLEEVLSQRLQELPPPHGEGSEPASGQGSPRTQSGEMPFLIDFDQRQRSMDIPAAVPPPDDWELDAVEIKFQERIASGAFGDLYKGTYCGQDVAIKILRNVQDDSQQYAEFLQEVSIMRKVRHKNVVQFIGACTRKPNLCIVVEYMPGGSVYDYMRRAGPLKLGNLLKVAVEICRGMDYLHKRKIAHRDLKAANLLMDETGTVKIADFGVARIMDTAGVMTAETGTYRWMAPEVIEHKPYGEKADVFSFGILLWELLTGRVPYEDMTPLQAAVGVVQKGLRPALPPGTPQPLANIMGQCWVREPQARPSFESLKEQLEDILEASRQEDTRRTQSAGFLSKLRKGKP